jgi:hypothetical protein
MPVPDLAGLLRWQAGDRPRVVKFGKQEIRLAVIDPGVLTKDNTLLDAKQHILAGSVDATGAADT